MRTVLSIIQQLEMGCPALNAVSTTSPLTGTSSLAELQTGPTILGVCLEMMYVSRTVFKTHVPDNVKKD